MAPRPFLSARNVRHAVEGSLRRRQTDHIDLDQMPPIDRNTPWEEIWQAMEGLVQRSKVIHVGSSTIAGWHLAQEAARARHFVGLVSGQSLDNLLPRTVELEVVPARPAHGLGLIPWSPLAGGRLRGVLRRQREGGPPLPAPVRSWSGAARPPPRSRPSAPSWARSRRRWRWPGCCTRRR